ncbi:MAG: type II toxin-antitoxin system prevent-host-death family antitoxin [Hyphomicrobiales bacterium]|nr:type II toxin-antitoxin system prevent-host-death family antitoxin [Hyphomicrobiales bacterium]
MKTMAASVANREFGKYLDTVQREPVLLTKRNRPVAVTMSVTDAEELLHFRVEAGIQKGLDDVKAGRFSEATPQNIAAMKDRIKPR